MSRCLKVLIVSVTLAATQPVLAQEPRRLGYAEALQLARLHAPSVDAARADELAVRADGRAAAVYPNPSFNAGSSTQAARLSLGASLPLVVFGQRGAARNVGNATALVAHQDTLASAAEARASAAQAYVGLWTAERSADALGQAAQLARELEATVQSRVDVGSAPALEQLRAQAERLRAEMNATAALELIDASASELARWIGVPVDAGLRTTGAPDVPAQPPPVQQLFARLPASPAIQRAQAEIRAGQARLASERAQLRPTMTLDLGADYLDPTLPATNYRAQLGVELPLFNQRGPMIEREELKTTGARFRLDAERAANGSALLIAYRSFNLQARRQRTLFEGVAPAIRAAAEAAAESYALGKTPLVALLEARRANVEVELDLVATTEARARAWIEVERLLGTQ